MARPTMVPTLHQFFSRKGEECKDTTDDAQIIQTQMKLDCFVYSERNDGKAHCGAYSVPVFLQERRRM